MKKYPPMKRTTPSNPCPVCGRNGWCMVAEDKSAAICPKTMEGAKKDLGAAGYLHILKPDQEPVVYKPRPKPVKEPSSDTNWQSDALRYAANLDARDRIKLALELDLPENGLNCIDLLGWRNESKEGCFTFPERDGSGKIIGLNRRYADKSKKVILGSGRGITLPRGWATATDAPLYIVEGPTDAAAMVCAKLKAIGRPSNRAGSQYLAEAIKSIDPSRPIIVLGENDEKCNDVTGKLEWPGLEGATSVAQNLARLVPNPVFWSMPPDWYKDPRDWLTSKNHNGREWEFRGKDFAYIVAAGMKPAAMTIEDYKKERIFEDDKFDFESQSWDCRSAFDELLAEFVSTRRQDEENDMSALFR